MDIQSQIGLFKADSTSPKSRNSFNKSLYNFIDSESKGGFSNAILSESDQNDPANKHISAIIEYGRKNPDDFKNMDILADLKPKGFLSSSLGVFTPSKNNDPKLEEAFNYFKNIKKMKDDHSIYDILLKAGDSTSVGKQYKQTNISIDPESGLFRFVGKRSKNDKIVNLRGHARRIGELVLDELKNNTPLAKAYRAEQIKPYMELGKSVAIAGGIAGGIATGGLTAVFLPVLGFDVLSRGLMRNAAGASIPENLKYIAAEGALIGVTGGYSRAISAIARSLGVGKTLGAVLGEATGGGIFSAGFSFLDNDFYKKEWDKTDTVSLAINAGIGGLIGGVSSLLHPSFQNDGGARKEMLAVGKEPQTNVQKTMQSFLEEATSGQRDEVSQANAIKNIVRDEVATNDLFEKILDSEENVNRLQTAYIADQLALKPDQAELAKIPLDELEGSLDDAILNPLKEEFKEVVSGLKETNQPIGNLLTNAIDDIKNTVGIIPNNLVVYQKNEFINDNALKYRDKFANELKTQLKKSGGEINGEILEFFKNQINALKPANSREYDNSKYPNFPINYKESVKRINDANINIRDDVLKSEANRLHTALKDTLEPFGKNAEINYGVQAFEKKLRGFLDRSTSEGVDLISTFDGEDLVYSIKSNNFDLLSDIINQDYDNTNLFFTKDNTLGFQLVDMYHGRVKNKFQSDAFFKKKSNRDLLEEVDFENREIDFAKMVKDLTDIKNIRDDLTPDQKKILNNYLDETKGMSLEMVQEYYQDRKDNLKIFLQDDVFASIDKVLQEMQSKESILQNPKLQSEVDAEVLKYANDPTNTFIAQMSPKIFTKKILDRTNEVREVKIKEIQDQLEDLRQRVIDYKYVNDFDNITRESSSFFNPDSVKNIMEQITKEVEKQKEKGVGIGVIEKIKSLAPQYSPEEIAQMEKINKNIRNLYKDDILSHEIKSFIKDAVLEGNSPQEIYTKIIDRIIDNIENSEAKLDIIESIKNLSKDPDILEKLIFNDIFGWNDISIEQLSKPLEKQWQNTNKTQTLDRAIDFISNGTTSRTKRDMLKGAFKSIYKGASDPYDNMIWKGLGNLSNLAYGAILLSGSLRNIAMSTKNVLGVLFTNVARGRIPFIGKAKELIDGLDISIIYDPQSMQMREIFGDRLKMGDAKNLLEAATSSLSSVTNTFYDWTDGLSRFFELGNVLEKISNGRFEELLSDKAAFDYGYSAEEVEAALKYGFDAMKSSDWVEKFVNNETLISVVESLVKSTSFSKTADGIMFSSKFRSDNKFLDAIAKNTIVPFTTYAASSVGKFLGNSAHMRKMRARGWEINDIRFQRAFGIFGYVLMGLILAELSKDDNNSSKKFNLDDLNGVGNNPDAIENIGKLIEKSFEDAVTSATGTGIVSNFTSPRGSVLSSGWGRLKGTIKTLADPDLPASEKIPSAIDKAIKLSSVPFLNRYFYDFKKVEIERMKELKEQKIKEYMERLKMNKKNATRLFETILETSINSGESYESVESSQVKK